MKVGDLVRVKKTGKVHVITRIYEKKVWHTDAYGTNVNWGKIDPEPFARILVSGGQTIGLPLAELELVDESR